MVALPPMTRRTTAIVLLIAATAMTVASAGQIHVTVDFNDDFRKAGGPVGRSNIEEQMAHFAELGIARVYWIHHAEDLFLPRPLALVDREADLLTIAVEAAHQEGLEIYALFKPFETGRAGAAFPPQVRLPDPDRSGALESIGGFHPMIAPFVREHPDFRLRRRAFDPLMDRAIDRIRLVKEDEQPTRLRGEDLKLFTGTENGAFHPHDGPFDFRDEVETRKDKTVRVLTLSGLDLPLSTRFMVIQSLQADPKGDFRNLENRIIELGDREGKGLPATVDEGRLTRDQLTGSLHSYFMLRHGQSTIPAGTLPEDYGLSLAKTAFHFDAGNSSLPRILDGAGLRDGIIAVARGHNTHTVGALHPAYPEVRDYWRHEILTRCVDAGVDGISIRVANHSSWTSEGALFGFNPPALDAFRERHGASPADETDPRWRELQGSFFTRFLRELKADLSRREVPLQISINHLMLRPIPGWRKNNVPVNIRFEWEKWISGGIADSIELKYFPWPFGAHRDTGMELVPQITNLADAHGIPVFFNVRFDTGIPWREILVDEDGPAIAADDPRLAPLRNKLRAAATHPGFDGVILYEGASFTQMFPRTGETKMAPFMNVLIDEMRD